MTKLFHSIRNPIFIVAPIPFLFLLTLDCEAQPNSSTNKKERTSAYYPGDFIIGALFSIHHQPTAAKNLDCGAIRETYGIQRAEVTFQTLDKINADKELLPNITLGAEIRDSCWYAPIALQQTIELVRDSITPSHIQKPCQSSETQNSTRKRGTLIGVLGPGSSSVAMQVQNLLQLFGIPQVAYSATSRDLSDKGRFGTFMRVVPSDYYQAQLMVDLVRWHNWTYVTAVNTDENYGQSGMAAFRELANRAGICIAQEHSILSHAPEKEYDELAVAMSSKRQPLARVVVCFCEGRTVRHLLAALHRKKLAGDLLIIGSDGWADRSDVAVNYEREAQGSISVRIHSPYVSHFDPYYLSLKPHTNNRNPWFREFWQSKFACAFPGEQLATVHHGDSGEFMGARYPFGKLQNCTGNESLSKDYNQDTKMDFIIRAIYVMARALHSMQVSICGHASAGACDRLLPFNVTLYKSFLLNTTFDGGDGEQLKFDKNGDPPGRYDIMNYQQTDGSWSYVQVGEWHRGWLDLRRPLQYPDGENVSGNSSVINSVCSQPCSPGFYKTRRSDLQSQCCWECIPCGPHQVQITETECQNCSEGSYPDANKTVCLKSPIEYLQWTDGEALAAMSFASVGFFVTFLATVSFLKNRDTPVVKASTRELSFFILFGMIMSYASIFPLIAKPSELTCTLGRAMPGTSLAIIYGSLFTKTHRIARILAGSKKRFPTRRPRFMSGTAQICIACTLVTIEAVVVVVTLHDQQPAPQILHPQRARTVLACPSSARCVLAPLVVPALLVALCTLYAFKTRRVPENFNEAKFIGFAMYTTCVIWVAFVPIYFGSDSKTITMCLCVTLSAMVTLVFLFFPKLYIMMFICDTITMCLCVTLSAMVTLVFLFFPKLYIIHVKPEKNNRALYITAKSIRCHIGAASNKSSNSRTDSTKFESPHHIDIKQQEISWKEETLNSVDSTSSVDQMKMSRRSISCQTSFEQLYPYSESSGHIKNNYIHQWTELNPKLFLNVINNENLQNNQRNERYQNIQPVIGTSIREESVSVCSLNDMDCMTQIKDITITLGSIDSMQKCVQNDNIQILSNKLS